MLLNRELENLSLDFPYCLLFGEIIFIQTRVSRYFPKYRIYFILYQHIVQKTFSPVEKISKVSLQFGD